MSTFRYLYHFCFRYFYFRHFFFQRKLGESQLIPMPCIVLIQSYGQLIRPLRAINLSHSNSYRRLVYQQLPGQGFLQVFLGRCQHLINFNGSDISLFLSSVSRQYIYILWLLPLKKRYSIITKWFFSRNSESCTLFLQFFMQH